MQEEIVNSVSRELNKCINLDYLSIFRNIIPKKPIEKYIKENKGKIRNRVYNLQITIEGMLIQASQHDKSKQNAVLILSELHEAQRKNIREKREKEKKEYQKEIKRLNAIGNPKTGKRKTRFAIVQKSKEKEVSKYTSSYDEATIRLPEELMKEILEDTTDWFKVENMPDSRTKWKDLDVYVVDGTTLQTQDTKELRKYFDSPKEKYNLPLPIVKIGGLINLYGGGIVGLEVDKYTSSEERMLKKLIDRIPENTLLLGDNLYCSYGILSLAKKRNIHILMQKKRQGIKEIQKDKIDENESIVIWEKSIRKNPKWYSNEDILEESLILRKIEFINPADPTKKVALYSTLFDRKKYPTIDIIMLFSKRWEIEINFRQIKSILFLDYLRSKSVSMVKKEIYAHIILYNIIRYIISNKMTTTEVAFSPCSSTIQISNSMVKGPYVDKLGRSYIRWNAGRNPKTIKEK
jgi:hypothetical protein